MGLGQKLEEARIEKEFQFVKLLKVLKYEVIILPHLKLGILTSIYRMFI